MFSSMISKKNPEPTLRRTSVEVCRTQRFHNRAAKFRNYVGHKNLLPSSLFNYSCMKPPKNGEKMKHPQFVADLSTVIFTHSYFILWCFCVERLREDKGFAVIQRSVSCGVLCFQNTLPFPFPFSLRTSKLNILWYFLLYLWNWALFAVSRKKFCYRSLSEQSHGS